MKIVFITYHNWDTKRHGGFHQFAEYSVKNDFETVFFSFSRPYYSILKKDERLNKEVLLKLVKGVKYYVDASKCLINVTWPTLALPGFMRKYFPVSVNNFFMTSSLHSFNKFCDKWLDGVDCFVIESCDGVFLIDLLKNKYKNATFVYRPSDPIVDFRPDKDLILAEKNTLEKVDKVFVVNKGSLELYKEKYPHLDFNKFYIYSNGVVVDEYLKKYERPTYFPSGRIALFVGASPIDWNCVFYAAEENSNINFVIISPVAQPKEALVKLAKFDNVFYISGISPKEVPAAMCNADIIIQPIPKETGRYNKKSLSVTAQNYKAMAANKYIVSYMGPMTFAEYGIISTYSLKDFSNAVKENIGKEAYYEINMEEKNWDYICKEMFVNITG